MDILGTILWPIRWVIELILVGFHSLWTAIGMDPNDGWTWIASIAGLVIVVRSAMIPLMVKQIKSQRSMLDAAPEIKKIQDKYKGKRDQFSMEAMRRETMEVYQRTGSNPMASCWPMLVQMPIFFGLFSVLNGAQRDQSGVGMLSTELAHSFASASIWGAPLKATFLDNNGNTLVMWLAGIMVVVMSASQFITQKQIMSKNISQATRESPMFRQQQMMLYVLPLVFAVSGVAFPLGVMTYWLISNFWTMGQQWVVIRNMPTPGSEAAKAREERLKRRGKWVEPEKKDKDGNVVTAAAAPKPTQRQQPVSKQRAKKQGAQKPVPTTGAKDEAAKPDLAKKGDAVEAGPSTTAKPAGASGAKGSGKGSGKAAANEGKASGKGAPAQSGKSGKKGTSSAASESTTKNQAGDSAADEQ